MKKIISIALFASMLCCMAISTFAATCDQSENPKNLNAEITTTINPTYTVTIPANVNVNFNAESTDFGEIKVDAAQINPDKCINVTVTTDGTLKNSVDNTKVIPYKIMSGENEFTGADYFAEGDNSPLAISITKDNWDAAFAGEYSGTVTFTVAYTNR